MIDAIFSEHDDPQVGPVLLNSIEYLEPATYQVRFLYANGKTFTTNASVEKVDIGEGESIDEINFNSEKYGELVMKGFMASRIVCQAIIAFHKARSPF